MSDKSIKLTGNASRYIAIPSSIILNDDLDAKRVVTYIYFAMKCGKDNEIDFTIDSLVSWCGFVPNKHKNKMNDKFFEIIDSLSNAGFISCNRPVEDKNKHSYQYTACFNEDAMYNEINNPNKRFALLWIDEIKKIMNYETQEDNKYFNTATILLVFAYLRMMIYRRDEYRDAECFPEAYNEFCYKIASKVGISEKTLNIVLDVLTNDLELIYLHKLPVDKKENKYRTRCTIFCNTYKRNGSYLIASGENYYMNEVKNKLKMIREYI